MKKSPLQIVLLAFTGILYLSARGRLDTIPSSPLQTPETWLQSQPYVNIKLGSQEILLAQPSTSAIVYLLGILTIGIGLYILAMQAKEISRLWWGVALLLWGVGALLAGTSYEAFSYAIKCAGREVCLWTSWWEIGYLIVSVWSIDAMVLAEAWSCINGKWRKGLVAYALLHAAVYLVVVSIGTVLANKFLISFELLLVVSAPGVLSLFILNL